jgi:hypothetical protein
MNSQLLKLLISSFCLSCVSISITAQTSQQGFFLDNWVPKSIEILDFDALNQTTSSSTVTVTVDAGTVLSKVSRNVYGHNAAVWGGKLDQSATMVTNVNNLSPQVIRWPGGNMSNDYFWNASNQASCPKDLPPTFEFNDQLYGANEATSYVMTLNRYYSFLAQTNSTGINCVNYAYARYSTSADPVLTAAKYAADWVRYDNGRTKYWEIGNENYGSWETGYTIDQSLNKDGQPVTITGDLYGKHCKVFIEEMRKAAKEVGNDIKIGVVVYNTEGLNFDAVQFWNQGVMSQVGSLADFLIPHYYFARSTETNPTIILNTAAVEVTRVKTMLDQQLNTFTGLGPMPVALTEYNFNTTGQMQQVSYVNGMHGALVLGELIKNQYGQGNRWDFMNGWSNGDNHGLFAAGDPGIAQYTPRAPFFYYYYFQKYFGDKMIASSVTGSTDVVSYASKFSSGQSGIVLVNKGAVAQVVTLKMNNFKTGAKYYYYLLTGGGDNGDFSRKVLVNGITTTLAGGGPTNYATLKPYGTNVSGDIKLSLPKYGTVYVVVENDKSLQSQTIQFNPIPAKAVGDFNFNVSATSTSGLAVQFASSNPKVAIVSNGIVQIIGAGTCNIIAFQDGNLTYNPASQVIQSLTVTKASQTIVFPPLQPKKVGDVSFLPGATASSTLACTYTSSNAAVATIVNNQIEIKGAGSTIITAKQTGNINYIAATDATQNLVVTNPLSVQDNKESLQNQFELFPNPARNFVTIKLKQGNSKISIFNSAGALVYSNSVSDSAITIPVNQIGGNGIYVVWVNSNAKKLIVKQ